MKLGLIQMASTMDKQHNVDTAAQKVTDCAAQGGDLVVLPEIFNAPYSNDYFRAYAEPAGGPTWQALSRMAKQDGVWLVGGSIPEIDDAGKVYNTSFVFDGQGRQIARHRKMHLFDIDVNGGQRFKESDTFTPGDQVTVFDTPWGKIGLCICFDFRFPELARLMVLQGAQVLVVPAAFNMTTGPLHWDLAFRMRALDQQCFVAGCSPARDRSASYVAYGHSLVCNPWGEILTDCGEGEAVRVVDLDLGDLARYRAQIPILSGRRTDLYRTKQQT